jgi:serine/threonine protein kinase
VAANLQLTWVFVSFRGYIFMPNSIPTQPLAGSSITFSDSTEYPIQSGELAVDEGLLANRYQIFKILGRGGFAITYLARNVYLPGQPLCVIKHLAPKFTNPALLTIAKWRFYVEARTLSYLGSHSQIPLLIDYFRKDGEMYLVQEYVPGDTLFEAIRSQAVKTEAEVQDFLLEMLHLLTYLHNCRLIHRDIKPQNIIHCATDHRLVLIDFGAVADREGSNQDDQRLTIKAIGTPGYAPPEQILGQPVYASDIYALGMTCIFLLTGKEPIYLAVDPRTSEVRWRSEIIIGDDLADIIDKMIRIPLVDRYQSAVQVLQAIESRQLRTKLRRYIDSKYSHGLLDPQAGAHDANLPPAVRWAMQMASQQE